MEEVLRPGSDLIEQNFEKDSEVIHLVMVLSNNHSKRFVRCLKQDDDTVEREKAVILCFIFLENCCQVIILSRIQPDYLSFLVSRCSFI